MSDNEQEWEQAADEGEGTAVPAPQPMPVAFGVNIGRIPLPLKGETLECVLLDVHMVTGFSRLFLDPDAALSLSRDLAIAARSTKRKIRLATPDEAQAVSKLRAN